MITDLKLVSYGQGTFKSPVISYPITDPMMAVLSVLRRLVEADKSFFITEFRLASDANTAATRAFSVNQITGEVWFQGVLIYSFNPLTTGVIWHMAADVLYSIAQSTTRYLGYNYTVGDTITILTPVLYTCYGSINPGRTASSAQSPVTNKSLLLGIYEK